MWPKTEKKPQSPKTPVYSYILTQGDPKHDTATHAPPSSTHTLLAPLGSCSSSLYVPNPPTAEVLLSWLSSQGSTLSISALNTVNFW